MTSGCCADALLTTLTPEHAYAAALSGEPCRLIVDGRASRLRIDRWLGEADEADHVMVEQCRGATVDLGCGPGRMTAALVRSGAAALGVDSVHQAVRLARRRGAPAVVRDVFTRLPGEGRWETALLADGNIGMGGDPARLVRRVASLVSPGGRVVAEVQPPGSVPARHRLQLEVEGQLSAAFTWASVPADQLAALADSMAMRVLRLACHDGRWMATLQKSRLCDHQ